MFQSKFKQTQKFLRFFLCAACLVALRLNVQGRGFVQGKVEVPQILVILTLGKGMTWKRYVKIYKLTHSSGRICNQCVTLVFICNTFEPILANKSSAFMKLLIWKVFGRLQSIMFTRVANYPCQMYFLSFKFTGLRLFGTIHYWYNNVVENSSVSH